MRENCRPTVRHGADLWHAPQPGAAAVGAAAHAAGRADAAPSAGKRRAFRRPSLALAVGSAMRHVGRGGTDISRRPRTVAYARRLAQAAALPADQPAPAMVRLVRNTSTTLRARRIS